MAEAARPLIVGAGPVGLAAGVFLLGQGVRARVIDAAEGPAKYSKALAVNPRTLEILQGCGVTERMLGIGKRINGAQFWRGGKVIAEIAFDGIHPRYPYLLALSQGVTVRLLEEKLRELGGAVEWGTGLARCREGGGRVEVELTGKAGAERAEVPWLLAADGAHSVARRDLGIAFEGRGFDNEWHLLDVPLATDLPEDRAHIFFIDGGGFLFLIRVVDDGEHRGGDPLWRVMGDSPDVLAPLAAARATGPAVWASSFHVSHRVNARMQQGAVYFAGDSAHIHSPVGARGLNLGVEDAWVFARLLEAGRLAEYGRMRHRVDRRVVRRIELISRLARGESEAARVLRATALPVMVRTPGVRGKMIETVTGLDHPLEPGLSD